MVQPETQKTLAALQPLVSREMGWLLRLPYHEDGGELYPFVWDSAEQGEFNLWNLLQAEGWSRKVDPETVLESWRLPEQTGTVNGATWLLPSSDEAGILLNQATQTARLRHYQMLFDLLQSHLQNLQAFRLTCVPDQEGESQDAQNTDTYAVTMVLGATADGWLSIAPTIPHATPDQDFPFQMGSIPQSVPSTLSRDSSLLEVQIQEILTQLGTVQVYGYYGGGYNQVHDYKLLYATGDTPATAAERVLRAAGGLETRSFAGFQVKASEDAAQVIEIKNLEQFLQETFPQLRLDRICCWNWEHFYISAEQAGDRVGVVLRSRFTYNP